MCECVCVDGGVQEVKRRGGAGMCLCGKGDRSPYVEALGAEFALLFVSDKQPPRASRPSVPVRGGPPAEPPSSS